MKRHKRLSTRKWTMPVAFLDVVFLLLMSIILRKPTFDLKDMRLPAIAEQSNSPASVSTGEQKERLQLLLHADGTAILDDKEINPDAVVPAIAEHTLDNTVIMFAVEVDDTGSGSVEGFMQIARDAAAAGLWNQFVVVHKGIEVDNGKSK